MCVSSSLSDRSDDLIKAVCVYPDDNLLGNGHAPKQQTRALMLIHGNGLRLEIPVGGFFAARGPHVACTRLSTAMPTVRWQQAGGLNLLPAVWRRRATGTCVNRSTSPTVWKQNWQCDVDRVPQILAGSEGGGVKGETRGLTSMEVVWNEQGFETCYDLYGPSCLMAVTPCRPAGTT
ncbi:hypothetical protein PtA15_4A575 [Puccinia triticina]|uniref:Uncharacterized protein n=1 Tax=Puccinia triticina TaxID=208348 RepID=A0ABY7CG96_9BASI|nr:uncharacterized protein PtA15_4A575 [Puccinia triticina]WAQ84124.1 hypothetical protein PtA15_4A575 [Puccinia triticina]WAR54953.1 hypothetical protein PtB15_4B571 [Puccinia triticina]